MITSWADEEDKANAKYDAIRGKSKNNPAATTTTTTTTGTRGSQQQQLLGS
jgi:hypothetical protein